MASLNINPIRAIYDAATSLKGNARACVFLEPLFVIPHTLYTGFMTLYMLELGVSLAQVGLITSLGLVGHIFFALASPILTDKLGRRYSTLIFDFIGWGVPLVVWIVAQNIYFFIVAAFFNAFFRVVSTSWHCLMLEDSKPGTRVHIFNFLQLASITAGFFAPIAALLVSRMTLVPAMRIMLIFALASKSIMFVLRHIYTTETEIGQQKMQELKGISVWDSFSTYLPVLKRIAKDRVLIIFLFLRSLNFSQLTVRQTFLAVLVTQRLGFPDETVALFHFLNAIVMLLVLILVTPILAQYTSRWPISIGIYFHITATGILLLMPPTHNMPLLIISAILIALGTAIATPRIDALVANTIINEERSVANAIMSVFLLLVTVPFAYLGGMLSEIDVRLPFLMILVIFTVCLLILHVATIVERKKSNS